MTVKALADGIIFQFCDATTSDRFNNRTSSSILIAQGSGDQTGVPRWGKVISVGPKVEDIKDGDYVCIEAGKWTVSFKSDGEKFWKTNEASILLVDDEPHYHYID